jgi:opacity protein-like surface antigen
MKKILTVLVLAAMFASAAHAQPGGRIKLGAGVGFTEYANGKFSGKSMSISPEYHIGLTSNGNRQGLSFGLKGGFGYSHPDRSDFIAGTRTPTGSLRVLSVMAGAGPTYRTGPLSIGVAVVAGPSFNKFSVDESMRAAYRDQYGATLNSINVKHSVAVRSNLSVWYNLTSRFGLHSSLGYTVNRPTVETTVNGETSRGHWNMDRWSHRTGVAFGFF